MTTVYSIRTQDTQFSLTQEYGELDHTWINLPAWLPQACCHPAPTMMVFLLGKKEIMHAYKGIWRQFLKATDMGLLKGGSHHSLYVKGEFTPPGHFQLISQATTYLELVKLFSILDGFYYLILRDSRNSRKGSLVGE